MGYVTTLVAMQALNAAFPKLASLNLDGIHLDSKSAHLSHLTSLEELRLRRVILAPLTSSDVVAQPLRGAALPCSFHPPVSSSLSEDS